MSQLETLDSLLQNLNSDELGVIAKKIEVLRANSDKAESDSAKSEIQDTSVNSKFANKCQTKNIVVIGGRGQLGSFFVELFRAFGDKISILEKDNWNDANSKFVNADLVLVAVPIHYTQSVIESINRLPENCVLADVTSVKRMPLQTMLKTHAGPVLGLHPMFGPGVNCLSGQTIVVCEGRDKNKAQWLIDRLSGCKANLVEVSAEEHDNTMAIVQVLRHFSSVVYGRHLTEENVDLQQVLAMSSPIYRLELAMVGRLFAQDPDLYTEIIFAEQDNIPMMKRYVERYLALLSLVETNDKKQFKQTFSQTTDWFGEYAQAFLEESSSLLKAAHNHRNV